MGGRVACLDIKWRRTTSELLRDVSARRLDSLTMVEVGNASLHSKQLTPAPTLLAFEKSCRLIYPPCHLPSHCHGPSCDRHLYLLGLSARLPRITHDSMPSSEDLDRSSLKPISDGLLS
jgi:hypothetical protein